MSYEICLHRKVIMHLLRDYIMLGGAMPLNRKLKLSICVTCLTLVDWRASQTGTTSISSPSDTGWGQFKTNLSRAGTGTDGATEPARAEEFVNFTRSRRRWLAQQNKLQREVLGVMKLPTGTVRAEQGQLDVWAWGWRPAGLHALMLIRAIIGGTRVSYWWW